MDLTAAEAPMQLLITLAYAMLRMLAIFSMIPMLSRQALPGLLRIGVVAAMAVPLLPSLIEPAAVDRSLGEVIAVIAKEVLLGVSIGMLMAIPLWALEGMGAYVDSQRGASIAQIINPLTGHDSSPLGELFSQAALTYLLASGGMLILMRAVYASYDLWPVFSQLPRFDDRMPDILYGELDRLTRLAVLMGSPVLIAMFLAEMGLALVSRFTPQLQVFFLAMGIKSAIAMFVFAVYGYTLFAYAGPGILDLGSVLRTVDSLFVRGAR